MLFSGAEITPTTLLAQGGERTQPQRVPSLKACPVSARRDECPDRGMLAVARGVLMRVHQGVFEALAAPPVQGPDGTLVYGNWDVRHVLQQARRQATALRTVRHQDASTAISQGRCRLQNIPQMGVLP